MKRGVAIAQIVSLCFLLSCYFASNTSDASDGSSDSRDQMQDKIIEILECAQEETDACRKEIETLRHQSICDSAKRLVELVLEEWDLPPQHKVFESPRLVWEPKRVYPESIKLPQWTFTVVRGMVGPDGRVYDAEIQRSSGSDEVDSICFQGFVKGIYRPAIKNGIYVAAVSATTCEVRLE